jgi:hypothetical protein
MQTSEGGLLDTFDHDVENFKVNLSSLGWWENLEKPERPEPGSTTPPEVTNFQKAA